MKVCTSCGSEYPDDQSFCPADGSALKSTSTAADLVGAIVADRYRILEKLGEGGMGTVYLAEHVKMGRMSAIKVISKSLTQDADAIARFNREAANASRINHPNVCAIYDFGETEDGVIYLAMEFIEGESLTDLINREGALAPKRAADIARQTAEALEAAHEFGIVHRDLKPDNIMITKTRAGLDLAKVVDFGIAKAAGGDEKQNVTKTGLVVGTPEYMSPEQLSGDAVDGRSDIYSLALVFFRMLTDTLPFQADTAQEVMIKRLTDEPLKLKEALPEGTFPTTLQHVMDRALQRMPSDHPTTYGCMEALERLIQPGMTVLDLGTGSGILTITALKLGADRAVAMDIDPQAIRAARQNFRRTRLHRRVSIAQGSLPHALAPAQEFDLVVANISQRAICERGPFIAPSLKNQGAFVASGFLNGQKEQVVESMSASGLQLTEDCPREDWTTLVFRAP